MVKVAFAFQRLEHILYAVEQRLWLGVAHEHVAGRTFAQLPDVLHHFFFLLTEFDHNSIGLRMLFLFFFNSFFDDFHQGVSLGRQFAIHRFLATLQEALSRDRVTCR